MLNGIYTGVRQSKVKNVEFLLVLPHCFGWMISAGVKIVVLEVVPDSDSHIILGFMRPLCVSTEREQSLLIQKLVNYFSERVLGLGNNKHL